jgi:hypothetical protein
MAEKYLKDLPTSPRLQTIPTNLELLEHIQIKVNGTRPLGEGVEELTWWIESGSIYSYQDARR